MKLEEVTHKGKERKMARVAVSGSCEIPMQNSLI